METEFSSLNEWTQDQLLVLLNGFGFTKLQVEQLLQQASDPSVDLEEFYAGFLGHSKASAFLLEFNTKRKGLELEKKPKVSGIWETHSLNIAQLIGKHLKIDQKSSESVLLQLKELGDNIEAQKELLLNLGGSAGFETERIMILLQKSIKKDRDDLAKAQKEKETKKIAESSSKKKKQQKKLERVGTSKWCECMATTHDLVQNCLHCGFIICAFHSSSSKCPFCGKNPSIVEYSNLPGLDKAMKRSAQLIDFQANSAARTLVRDNAADFDVASDQFNKWASAEERALAVLKLQEKEKMEEEEKKRRVITLDIENKRVLVEKPAFTPLAAESTQSNQSTTKQVQNKISTGVYRNPTLTGKTAIFKSIKTNDKSLVSHSKTNRNWNFSRLQDER